MGPKGRTILLSFLGVFLLYCFSGVVLAESKIFFVVLGYDETLGEFFEDISDVLYGTEFVPDIDGERRQYAKVWGEEGLIKSYEFSINPRCNSCPNPDIRMTSLFLPHDPKATSVEIVSLSGESLLSVDMTKFCNNNNICEPPLENHLSCPNDCPSGSLDGMCDRVSDGICDPDCAPGVDPDCRQDTVPEGQKPEPKDTSLDGEDSLEPEAKDIPESRFGSYKHILTLLALVFGGIAALYLVKYGRKKEV
jgi:hypothetical protein